MHSQQKTVKLVNTCTTTFLTNQIMSHVFLFSFVICCHVPGVIDCYRRNMGLSHGCVGRSGYSLQIKSKSGQQKGTWNTSFVKWIQMTFGGGLKSDFKRLSLNASAIQIRSQCLTSLAMMSNPEWWRCRAESVMLAERYVWKHGEQQLDREDTEINWNK